MILARDFSADFTAITAGLLPGYTASGRPPYAFSRYADGEANIIAGRPHFARSDGWQWYGGNIGTGQPEFPSNRKLPADLRAALRCELPGWNVGITAESHHPREHHELLAEVRVPPENITFAEILIFDNYRRWVSLDLSHCWFVSSLVPRKGAACGWIEVPRHAVNMDWDHRPVVERLLKADIRSPIILAAGPYAKLIAHDYWLATEDKKEIQGRRQVIFDAGSALDQFLPRGRARRRYQMERYDDSRRVPKWKIEG